MTVFCTTCPKCNGWGMLYDGKARPSPLARDTVRAMTDTPDPVEPDEPDTPDVPDDPEDD